MADGALKLRFRGQLAIDSVPLEHAKWFADLAGQLQLEQVRSAFEAAGATRGEAQQFASHLLEKIDELQTAVGSSR